ncbi:phd zinc finger-containing protein [Stylonychia lemnae]|uniref:Phd zinc finger-containing protein n=1 Tax=Stylonychia lemnae TaxID=5949 RepID=A0A078A3G5_STYLE|nr:phd zinc finger-containing protein [Stylonychia lemnae]|eukprot:CDW76823.1 phd zinc finger-containing protein [Stylonychia lemnae]
MQQQQQMQLQQQQTSNIYPNQMQQQMQQPMMQGYMQNIPTNSSSPINPFMNQYPDQNAYIPVQQQQQMPSNFQMNQMQNMNQTVINQADNAFGNINGTFGSSYDQPQLTGLQTQNINQQQLPAENKKSKKAIGQTQGNNALKRKRASNKNIWVQKSRKACLRAQRQKREKILGQQGLVGSPDLIDQINTLNIGGKSKAPKVKKPKESSKMQLDPSRTNPARGAKVEKGGYNESKMTQSNIEQFPKIVKEKKKDTAMEVDQTQQDDFVDPSNPYEKITITGNQNDEDIQCDVCLEYEYEDDDQIVMCDLCNVGVHQSCYGSDLTHGVPVGNWYCERCSVLLRNRDMKCTEIKCFLCPDIDGVLKQIDNELWAHAICVNWNPDIYFTDAKKNKVEGVLNKQRFELNCQKCHKKGKGTCIQCDYKNCSRSYHVRCAVRRGLIQEWEKMEDKAGEAQDNFIPVFCEDHEKKGYEKFKKGGKQEIQSIQMTQAFKEKAAERLNKYREIQSQKTGKQVKKAKIASKFNKKKTLKVNGINLSNKQAFKDIKDVVQRISCASNSQKKSKKVKGKNVRKIQKSKDIPRPQHKSIGKQQQGKKRIIQSARSSKANTKDSNQQPNNQLNQMMQTFSQFMGNMMTGGFGMGVPQNQGSGNNQAKNQPKTVHPKTKAIMKGRTNKVVKPREDQKAKEVLIKESTQGNQAQTSLLSTQKRGARTKKQQDQNQANNMTVQQQQQNLMQSLYPQAPFNPYLGTPIMSGTMFGNGQSLPKIF